MKKARKQCLGFFGLGLVATMTAVAANIPAPEVLATSNSITDTITVRVVGDTPAVNFKNIEYGAFYIDPNHVVSFDYENVDNTVFSLKYTDKNDIAKDITVSDEYYDYNYGTKNFKIADLNPSEDGSYNYGKYALHLKGAGFGGSKEAPIVEDENIIYFVPTVGRISINEYGKYFLETESTAEVKKIAVQVYNSKGELIADLLPAEVLPNGKVEILFVDKSAKTDTYTFKITSYGDDDEVLYKPFDLETKYTEPYVPNAGDTGGLFKNVNIAKEDYLISGLILFFVLGIVAFGVVARDKKAVQKKRRR